MDSDYIEEIIKQLSRIADAQEKIAKELETANNRPVYFYDKPNGAGYFVGLVDGVWGVLSDKQENELWIQRLEEAPKLVAGRWESSDEVMPLSSRDRVIIKTEDGRIGTAERNVDTKGKDKWVSIRTADGDLPIKSEEVVMWGELNA